MVHFNANHPSPTHAQIPPSQFKIPIASSTSWDQSFQRKMASAITKGMTLHAPITAISVDRVTIDLPSIISARKASITGVNGNSLITGWTISGKRSYEKKMPLRVHIGSMTRFISPDAVSIVLAREATRNPIPAHPTDTRRMMSKMANQLPRTWTQK